MKVKIQPWLIMERLTKRNSGDLPAAFFFIAHCQKVPGSNPARHLKIQAEGGFPLFSTREGHWKTCHSFVEAEIAFSSTLAIWQVSRRLCCKTEGMNLSSTLTKACTTYISAPELVAKLSLRGITKHRRCFCTTMSGTHFGVLWDTQNCLSLSFAPLSQPGDTTLLKHRW